MTWRWRWFTLSKFRSRLWPMAYSLRTGGFIMHCGYWTLLIERKPR